MFLGLLVSCVIILRVCIAYELEFILTYKVFFTGCCWIWFIILTQYNNDFIIFSIIMYFW